MGKLVFTIFAALGEFEKSLIGERVRAGLAAARLRGKHLGRSLRTPGVLVPFTWGLMRFSASSWRLMSTPLDA